MRTLRGHTGPNVTRDAIRYNAPPWPITHTHVHDTIAHGEEHTSTKGFGEEVSKIVDGAHERAPNERAARGTGSGIMLQSLLLRLPRLQERVANAVTFPTANGHLTAPIRREMARASRFSGRTSWGSGRVP